MIIDSIEFHNFIKEFVVEMPTVYDELIINIEPDSVEITIGEVEFKANLSSADLYKKINEKFKMPELVEEMQIVSEINDIVRVYFSTALNER